MHPDVEIQVVKRFADVIMESREREERGRLIREVRVSNLADNIETDWERYRNILEPRHHNLHIASYKSFIGLADPFMNRGLWP